MAPLKVLAVLPGGSHPFWTAPAKRTDLSQESFYPLSCRAGAFSPGKSYPRAHGAMFLRDACPAVPPQLQVALCFQESLELAALLRLRRLLPAWNTSHYSPSEWLLFLLPLPLHRHLLSESILSTWNKAGSPVKTRQLCAGVAHPIELSLTHVSN